MKTLPWIEVEMSDLEEILARSRSVLSDDDHGKLTAAVETLGWLTHELEAKRVSVARLKKLLFGQTSEKTEDVLAQDEQAEGADDGSADSKGEKQPEGGKKDRKGHGRNGANEYEGAERVKVPHPTLKPGNPCPEIGCEGKVYRLKEPGMVVRITAKPPLEATVYECEKLRCHLCGKIFTAEPPEGIGEEKYDATSASMIALLKYGSCMPFNRLERLEGSLGIPLPAATQWDIVHGASKTIGPAYEELVRQAAQGEVSTTTTRG